MHNKAFIVDGSIAIMGGRNIAEEYFDLKPQQAFDDFEMVVFGEVVSEIAGSFDRFWNSSQTVPMEAIKVSDNPERVDRWLTYMEQVVSGERESPYAAAINSQFLKRVMDDDIEPYVSTADLFYDSPDKLKVSRRDAEQRRLASAVRDRLASAREEVVVINPYMVPRGRSYPMIRDLRARGVRVILITNSLASTNHVAVHSAYGPKRKAMLQDGAELYEIKVDAASPFSLDDSEEASLTLHTKAIIIDRESLFVGSLNLDPRSIEINTEIGLFIDSPEAASDYRDIVFQDLDRYTYQVFLDEKNRLRWRDAQAGETLSSEPRAGAWRRFKAGFYRLLPIEGQL